MTLCEHNSSESVLQKAIILGQICFHYVKLDTVHRHFNNYSKSIWSSASQNSCVCKSSRTTDQNLILGPIVFHHVKMIIFAIIFIQTLFCRVMRLTQFLHLIDIYYTCFFCCHHVQSTIFYRQFLFDFLYGTLTLL